jgi:hypothetical protein
VAQGRATQPKEATVPPDQILEDLLLLPPEWELDWDGLLLPDLLPSDRLVTWIADWDEAE